MDKIIIVVQGGAVQEIFTSNKNVKIKIIDYDSESVPYKLLENKQEELTKDLQEVRFSHVHRDIERDIEVE